MDHVTSAWRPDLVIVYKKLPNSEPCRYGWSQGKTEGKQKKKYEPRPYNRTEKTMEYESYNDTNCNWCT